MTNNVTDIKTLYEFTAEAITPQIWKDLEQKAVEEQWDSWHLIYLGDFVADWVVRGAYRVSYRWINTKELFALAMTNTIRITREVVYVYDLTGERRLGFFSLTDLGKPMSDITRDSFCNLEYRKLVMKEEYL